MIRIHENKAINLFCLVGLVLYTHSGCQTPSRYRVAVDNKVIEIIKKKQKQALGYAEKFTIERPSDILRRRLLVGQNLLSSSLAIGCGQLLNFWHKMK